MSTESDGSFSEMEIDDTGQWKKVRHKRKSREGASGYIIKKNKLTQENINKIIGTTSYNTKN